MRDLGEQAEIAGVKITILEYWIDSVTFGASLVAQLVKNPPAMLETLVRFLHQEDPLERIVYPLQDSWASLVAQMV